ncbi:MAG: hypothetical protein K1Y36_25770 [Blastocatellia bacterium]|nr:hypothetical protein [Blastocatellia bacterium]
MQELTQLGSIGLVCTRSQVNHANHHFHRRLRVPHFSYPLGESDGCLIHVFAVGRLVKIDVWSLGYRNRFQPGWVAFTQETDIYAVALIQHLFLFQPKHLFRFNRSTGSIIGAGHVSLLA